METTLMGYIGVILGLYWGYTRVILGLYWGYIGIMEKKMEATIMGYIEVILGLYRDNGKENGSYHNGLYRDYIGVT